MAKVTISIPDDLLHRIDCEARRRHRSRSALLQEAARRELGWAAGRDVAAIDAAVASARKALAGAGAFESAALIRAERDARGGRGRRRVTPKRNSRFTSRTLRPAPISAIAPSKLPPGFAIRKPKPARQIAAGSA